MDNRYQLWGSSCPQCGKQVPHPEGDCCTHCRLKNEGKTIHDYYLDLASITIDSDGSTWKQYFTEMADWDKKDSFVMSSADGVTPIYNEFDFNLTPTGNLDPKAYAKSHGIDWGDPRFAYCPRMNTWYVVVGFTGGAIYHKVEL